VLKIDREFIVATDTLHGRAFVRALIELGECVGTRIIAEGIETADQATRLRTLGCHEGQGFFWAPALSLEQAEALLTTGLWPHPYIAMR
jgi:EAL domain-containing protein (putative c-di-GMP-specific phosphodiesterase class I)